jgi:pimeloyl-ACP methyl ester carboxylesterase
MTRSYVATPSLDRRGFLGGSAAVAAATLGGVRVTGAAQAQATRDAQPTFYRTTTVADLTIFYREAGDPSAPTILLLHGFPSSSHMFRDLIPLLADRFHLVAPDYPGFGHSDAPAANEFAYTFDHLADVMEGFVDAMELDSYSLYVQDFGAPVGFRLATRRPSQIASLIVQNGNAYEEGITDLVRPQLVAFGERPRTALSEQPVRNIFTLESTIFQYTEGVRDRARISPDAWTVDQVFLDRPGNDEIQLSLFHDYHSNLERYPEWHAYFRESQPPTLIVWGKNRPDLRRARGRGLPERPAGGGDPPARHWPLRTGGPRNRDRRAHWAVPVAAYRRNILTTDRCGPGLLPYAPATSVPPGTTP